MALQTLSVDGARFRAGMWRGRADLAYLVPLSPARTLTPDRLAAARHDLHTRGFSGVVTAALAPRERDALRDDGFVDREYLHLLRFDLTQVPPRPRPGRARLTRGWRRDWPKVLDLDASAFDDFWRLDESGLIDSLEATPVSRLRVARDGDGIIGYTVAGRAATQGYLQRLAVAPDHTGVGLGTAMVHDALRWMRRRGARMAWVNTQERNKRALRLYEHLGFRREPDKLTVLERALP